MSKAWIIAAFCLIGHGCVDSSSWDPEFDPVTFGEPIDYCEVLDTDTLPAGSMAIRNHSPAVPEAIEPRKGHRFGSIQGTVAFGDVTDAEFLGPQSLAVLDAQGPEVLVANLGSRELRVLTGAGDGPGEFRRIEGLVRLRDGRLLIGGRGRVALFDDDGGVVDTWQVPTRPFAGGTLNGRIVDATDSGTLLVAYPATPRFGTVPAASSSIVSSRDPDHLAWLSHDGDEIHREIGALAHPSNTVRSLSNGVLVSLPTPFDARGAAAVSGNRAYLSNGRDYRLVRRSVSDDSVVHILLCKRPRTLSAEAVRRFVSARVEVAQNPGRVAEILRNASYPTHRAAFGSVLVDFGGRIWVEDRGADESGKWLVFSPAGRWLYHVMVPEGRVLAVSDTSLAAVVELGLDVEAVQLYHFHLPEIDDP